MIVLGLWLACTPPTPTIELRAEQGGLSISAEAPIHQVDLYDLDGQPLARQRVPVGARQVYVPISVDPGARIRVQVDGLTRWWHVPVVGPVEVTLEAPVGQGRATAPHRGALSIVQVGQTGVRVAMVFTAREPSQLTVTWGDQVELLSLTAAGDRQIRSWTLHDQPVHVTVTGPKTDMSFDLVPVHQDLDDARAQIRVVDHLLPTDASGQPDFARPAHRVVLPARWWRALLQRFGLGYRPRDDQAPWAWRTVVLANDGDRDQNLMVRASVVDDQGQPAPAFRARIRGVAEDEVLALVRVPAGEEVRVAMPLFVDGSALPETSRFTQQISVLSLGIDEPLHRIEQSLDVRRGSVFASVGMVLALAASALGWLLLFTRMPRWTQQIRTTDLVAIALFGSVSFVLGTALQVVGLGFSAFLGPFSPFFVGLVDDTLRACLLGTLVVLVPQRGVLALATTVGFLMRGLTLGSFHPVDLLYLGSAVFWLETWASVAGLTRTRTWRDGPGWRQWLRLSVGLGGANVCATATGLVISVVFYRLYFAEWYVAAILLLPGFLYVAIGCAFAVSFARGLRRVEL